MSPQSPENARPQYHTCTIRSELRETQGPKAQILSALQEKGFSEESIFAVKLALEEALTNAVKHGNRCDPCKCVTVRYLISNEEAVVSIRDEGEGFSPGAVPDCTSPDRLPVPNGRGIMLMRAYMDSVSYQDCGREVTFVKRKDSPSSPSDRLAPSPQRRTIYYSGRVQGVGFRATAQDVAARHPVAGFIRNLPDGRVELVAEGIAADLDHFQKELESVMRRGISCVEAAASPATGEFSGFRIR